MHSYKNKLYQIILLSVVAVTSYIALLLSFAGYQCEYHDNPADFYLDVIMENEKNCALPQGASSTYMHLSYSSLLTVKV